MTRAWTPLTGLALATWLVCFAVLARWGTWLPFAVTGTVLVGWTLFRRTVPSPLLRPSARHVALGLLGGLLMVASTQLAYAAVSSRVPSVLPATRELFWLLNVHGFSVAERAVLIAVIASCEEVLFRGPLLVLAEYSGRAATRPPNSRHVGTIASFAAAYALTTSPLQSPLLLLCAFTCGCIWGALGIATCSLTVPILVHVIWDLGVLIVWPLATNHA